MSKILFSLQIENKNYSFEESFANDLLKAEVKKTKDGFSLYLYPTKKIKLEKISCNYSFEFKKQDLIFCNGYQSWTACKEHCFGEKEYPLRFFPKPLVKKYGLDKYGDVLFYSSNKGNYHGYTYAYVRREEKYFLFGSKAEYNGYTQIETDEKNNTIIFTKDCKGKEIENCYAVFDILSLFGSETKVFDDYFNALKITCNAKRKSGYTSWYNYYQKIDEKTLLKDLQAIKFLPEKADIFQIDDGYEKFVGDWLQADKNKFPNGMAVMAEEIHKNGLLAGIWLAPFVCEKNSDIFQTHQDWLLKDESGNLVYAGCNWSGMYVLDFYNSAVKDYIEKCLVTMQEWGYDLFKLDFLYAVAMFPQHNKTRAEIMFETMDFLRKILKDKLILGCGVPLAAAFGKVDYCRIGADVTLNYDDKIYMRFAHSERPSTKQTMQNSIYRRQLSGRAFLNDTDVFILRENNTKLSFLQKQNLAKVNGLFGGLLFSSDNASEYGELQKKLYQEIIQLKDSQIKFVGRKGKKTLVKYKWNGKDFSLEI